MDTAYRRAAEYDAACNRARGALGDDAANAVIDEAAALAVRAGLTFTAALDRTLNAAFARRDG